MNNTVGTWFNFAFTIVVIGTAAYFLFPKFKAKANAAFAAAKARFA